MARAPGRAVGCGSPWEVSACATEGRMAAGGGLRGLREGGAPRMGGRVWTAAWSPAGAFVGVLFAASTRSTHRP